MKHHNYTQTHNAKEHKSQTRRGLRAKRQKRRAKTTIKQLMKHVIDYARNERCDLIAFCTNKSNFRRLGLRRIGFLNSPKKFQVITRATGDSDVRFTEKFTRLTWIDSDTI